MFTAVFWNIAGKKPQSGIVRLITALQRQEDADFLALAECTEGVIGSVLRALNPVGQDEWEWISTHSRVRVLLRRRGAQIAEVGWHEYDSVLELHRLQAVPLLLAVTHMPSRVHKEFDHINEELGEFANSVRSVETQRGHTNTLLIGDLNSNPFDNGLVLPQGERI
jgi:hypothetical protein